MPKMHLRQPWFTYSACVWFPKNKERIQKHKETGDSGYIYRNELDKASFHHNISYIDFKDIPRWTTSDYVLHDIAVNITENRKYSKYRLASIASIV